MQLRATVANLLWTGGSFRSWRQFRAALRDPAATQQSLLLEYVQRNADTVFGRAHAFSTIRSIADFRARVPVRGFDELEPFIRRIQQGEPRVLTSDPVTRLVPSSGSSSAAKLIPYTARLHTEISRAVDPWIFGLYRRSPTLAAGRAYWAITPALTMPRIDSAVPIGFDDDSAYLGGARRALVQSVFAVPPEMRLVGDVETLRYATLLCLLRTRDLRIISVWHPSFLTSLLDAMRVNWSRLQNDLSRGTLTVEAGLPESVRAVLQPACRRAAELGRLVPEDLTRIWPALSMVSCWADGPAAAAADDLRRRLPGVVVQPKGLIATEGIVTIPFDGLHPVAVRSHFVEFLDQNDTPLMVHELAEGEDYRVVLTTGGGLYRYRLADRVTVDGWVGRTPSLRFIGKDDCVSDRFGEKLSDGFVARVLASLFPDRARPRFAMLSPEHTSSGLAYTLWLESDRITQGLAETLESALRRNPHYALCVDLGQLRPARVLPTRPGANRAYIAACVGRGRREGDVKPVSLHPESGWGEVLADAIGELVTW